MFLSREHASVCAFDWQAREPPLWCHDLLVLNVLVYASELDHWSVTTASRCFRRHMPDHWLHTSKLAYSGRLTARAGSGPFLAPGELAGATTVKRMAAVMRRMTEGRLVQPSVQAWPSTQPCPA